MIEAIGVVVILTLLAFVLGSGCYVVGFAMLAIGKGISEALYEWAKGAIQR